METTTIDARGLSCPQPVIMTLAAIKRGDKSFTILVNSEVSKENVMRCLAKHKFNAASEKMNDEYAIKAFV